MEMNGDDGCCWKVEELQQIDREKVRRMELDSNTPSMYTKYLPQYTTEKYYLISELELFADLLSINDIIKETDQNNKNSNINKCNAIYILWDYQTESYESFQSRVNQFVTQLTDNNINTNNTIMSIQILIPSSLKDELSYLTGPNTINNILLSQLYELHNVYNKRNQLIVFGISDNISSTIALEFIHDWFTMIRQTSLTTLIDSTINSNTGTSTTITDNNTSATSAAKLENKRQIKPKISLNYRLIAQNEYDYLGFHDDEPDADSGAFQLVCAYSTNINNKQCIQTLINTMLLSILSSYRESPSNLLTDNNNTDEGDNKGKLSRNYSIVNTHDNTNNSSSNSIYIILFYTISAVVLLLSVLGYLLNFNRLIVW